jgi:RNA polymerase sigma-70 factor, ECF subfamily
MTQAVLTEPRRRKAAPSISDLSTSSCRTRARGVYSTVHTHPRKPMSKEAFDQDYIDALVQGRADIQDHFTAYFGDLLFIKVRSRVRSAQLREDIVQETFLRSISFLKRGHLDHPERLGAFMCRVCDNITKESFRKLGRDSVMPEGQSDPPDESADSEERLVTDQRKRQVRKLLEEMPERDQRLLRAIFIDDRDKDEVCREFQVDRNYLRVLLHRAKGKFREGMERGGAALMSLLFT